MKLTGPFVTIVLVVLVHALGILIFTTGFLLTRIVVNEESACDHSPLGSLKYKSKDGCWVPSRFNRAIVIVIDALRIDFTVYDDTLEDVPPYRNKLPIINSKLKASDQDNARLFRFIADPPTTTMQRLKGLTTGSLPTFIDAGSNFASSEIDEDNIIRQFGILGKKIHFMGDDTWESLFPGKFESSHPFDSFNVKDLDTVDQGVVKHLFPVLRNTTSDWDIIIAHFLGVDHCGHTYGPNHIEMTRKLTEMNTVLTDVMDSLDDDTLLIVFGDHGMTPEGDHGGDSANEVDAAMFMYSNSPLSLKEEKTTEVKSLPQIDLVPTLAMLLGSPIPFSNLGSIIEDFFFFDENGNILESYKNMNNALYTNFLQVHKYLEVYNSVSSDIPAHFIHTVRQQKERLEREYMSLERDEMKGGEDKKALYEAHEKFTALTKSLLVDIREECKTIWAKFDMFYIGWGLCILTLGALVSLSEAVYLSCFSELCSIPERVLWFFGGSIGTCGEFYNNLTKGHFERIKPSTLLFAHCMSGSVACFWLVQSYEVSLFSTMVVLFPRIGFLCFAGGILVHVSTRQRILDISGTVISLLFFTLLFLLVSEMKLAPTFAANVVCVICVLNVLAIDYAFKCCRLSPEENKSSPGEYMLAVDKSNTQHLIFSRRLPYPWYSIVLWYLLRGFLFFATGHQSTFPTIDWRSGFVGFHDMHIIFSGVLVVINTFSAHIFFVLGCPLLIYGVVIIASSYSGAQIGEHVLEKHKETLKMRLFFTYIVFMLLLQTTTASSAFAATIHRRHLMVWKIFAPKFIFEAVGSLISSLFLLVLSLVTV
eukprot:Nk52_evm48s352 gene=Nk52_evmTU48s352